MILRAYIKFDCAKLIVRILGLTLGWKPKEGAMYSSHNSVHERMVGQKVYITTRVINRTVKIIISGKVLTGSFSVSKGICTIRVRLDDKERRLLTQVSNVKFDKKVTHSEGSGQNQYGTRFRYSIAAITYTAQVIDAKKMEDITEELSGYSNSEIMKKLFKFTFIKPIGPNNKK